MNTIDAIEIVRDLAASSWHASAEERQALEVVAQLVAAYDALAPKPDEWPEGATHYAINPNGASYWHCGRPEPYRFCWSVPEEMVPLRRGEAVILHPGIDWRLCIWERPEAPQEGCR